MPQTSLSRWQNLWRGAIVFQWLWMALHEIVTLLGYSFIGRTPVTTVLLVVAYTIVVALLSLLLWRAYLLRRAACLTLAAWNVLGFWERFIVS